MVGLYPQFRVHYRICPSYTIVSWYIKCWCTTSMFNIMSCRRRLHSITVGYYASISSIIIIRRRYPRDIYHKGLQSP